MVYFSNALKYIVSFKTSLTTLYRRVLIYIANFVSQSDSYCHIDAMDMNKVRVCVEDTQVWMTNIKDSQNKRTPDQEPATHSTQIKEKLQVRKD